MDGNNTNNCLSNLAWGTFQENSDDRVLHGTQTKGEEVYCAKLNPKMVRTIRNKFKNGVSITRLATTYEFSYQGMEAVVHRKTWKHVV